MAERGLIEHGPSFIVEAGQALAQGDLVAWSAGNTDYRDADASDEATYAQFIVLDDVAADGDPVRVAKWAIMEDTDDNGISASIDAPLYLSATAAEFTTTRPTGANDLKQRVGVTIMRHGGTGASLAFINIRDPWEQMVWVDLPYAEGSAAVTADADWSALSMTADADAAHGVSMVPENAVSLVQARLWIYNEDTLAGGSYTVDVSAGVSDEAGTAHEDGITSTAVAVLTADDLVSVDISAAFDGAGLIDPGNHFGVDIAKASETAADDYRFHGVAMTYEVV